MLLRLVALLICFPLPPLGVYLARGAGPGFFINLALTAGAIGVFFGLFAGPGLALFGVAVLHALVLILTPTRRNPAPGVP